VNKSQPLGQVVNALNAVSISAEPLGDLILQAAGAGGGATASAVLADISDISLGFGRPLFDSTVAAMTESASSNALPSEFYIRLALADKPGSMAKATQILLENGVSIEEVVQRSSEAGDSYLPVVFITHQTETAAMEAALAALALQSEICNSVLALPVFVKEV
jgi:homoserine dehydrogenase